MATFNDPTFDGANRAIGFALVISLALHIALLWILPSLREANQRRTESDPIHARLAEPAPQRRVAEPAPPIELPRPAEPQLAPPKPAATQPAVRRSFAPRTKAPEPVAPRSETPPPVPTKNEPTEAEPERSTAAAASASVAAPSASIAAQAPRPAPPPAETLDAGTLAQYRLSLISAARRFKRYPRVALDQNWQGNAEVRLVVAANGEIAALVVRSSAGYPVLDQHALEMIERAKALAPIPPALRGKQFTVDIPIVFSLREAGG